MEFKMIYLSEPVIHDEKACKAWGEFRSLHVARGRDLFRIATKYETTPQEMKEHKDCWKYK